MDPTARFRRDDDVAHQQIDSEYLLVPVRSSVHQKLEIFSLNPIGAFIWASLEAPSSVAELSQKLAQVYEVELAQAQRDATAFLEQLLSRGLIAPVKG